MSASTSTRSLTGTWAIDPAHSVVEFAVKHMMISTVKGNFLKVDGSIDLNEESPSASSAVVTIDVASITTGNDQRDTHLRSDDFFSAEQFPHLTFRSTQVDRLNDTEYTVHGELTIRDQTKPVVLKTEYDGQILDPWGMQRVAFSATTEINRKEFGLNWNAVLESGGVVVSDKVKITLHIEATRPA